MAYRRVDFYQHTKFRSNRKNGNVSLGGLGAGRIAYWLEGCELQNLTCGLFSLKPTCDNSAVNF